MQSVGSSASRDMLPNMIEGWVFWLFVVGLAVGAVGVGLLLIRLPHTEDDVTATERHEEAGWISSTIERHGGIAPPSLVEEVLDLHQAYLRDARRPLEGDAGPVPPASSPRHAPPYVSTPGSVEAPDAAPRPVPPTVVPGSLPGAPPGSDRPPAGAPGSAAPAPTPVPGAPPAAMDPRTGGAPGSAPPPPAAGTTRAPREAPTSR